MPAAGEAVAPGPPGGRAITYLLLLIVKLVARIFFRFDVGFVGQVPKDPWADLRLIAILNHTSLYEPLFAGGVPNRLVRQIARDGLVPVAAKTMDRPLVGLFFRMIIPHPVPVTRRRDTSWEEFAAKITPGSLVVILPEGRMKRRDGLDSQGRPMTVRGGIADVLEAIPDGRMLLAYSGGLHHVQVPGDHLPTPFRLLRMRFETVDIAEYRKRLHAAADGTEGGFKGAVIQDLERRRDLYCPPMERAAGIHYPRS